METMCIYTIILLAKTDRTSKPEMYKEIPTGIWCYYMSKTVIGRCVDTHWCWDFINIAKVGGSNKKWWSVLCINHVDSECCSGWHKLLLAIQVAAAILKKTKEFKKIVLFSKALLS